MISAEQARNCPPPEPIDAKGADAPSDGPPARKAIIGRPRREDGVPVPAHVRHAFSCFPNTDGNIAAEQRAQPTAVGYEIGGRREANRKAEGREGQRLREAA
jgi:hypothetical protein